MAAWAASPYRAIGVYIGGDNRGCSQPNLTSSWVSAQTAAGWHLIPTYVGLQAPTSSCSSCAKLTASRATAQGEEAAVDAVAQAAAVAIGPGSPIYFDMESYTRTSSATAATLTFLEAWTEKLHALGYVSGVYSSGASGIADLADEVGTGYVLPDNLWIANWNGQATTTDPYVPATAWAQHQRIHQYRGGHDETYGGVTINIDNNYVDGGTVGTAASTTTNEDPIGSLELVGSPSPGPGAGQGLGLRPQRPDRTAVDPRLRRRPARRPGRRLLRPRPGRQPGPPRRRRQVPAGRRQPRLRRHLPDRQVGAAAGLRLRAQHRRRHRPPARLQVDHGPGRGHPLGA